MSKRKIGPYQLTELIGVGSVGSIHAAVDTRGKQRVALKILLPEVSLPLPGKWERWPGVSEEGREVLLLPQQAAREPEGAG